jgi:hypothetical protein
MSNETYFQGYTRLLNAYIEHIAESQTQTPLELIDRIEVGYEALVRSNLSPTDLQVLLAIAVDRLAIQKVGAP